VVTTKSIISKIDIFALKAGNVNIFALARLKTTMESVMSEIDIFASTVDNFFTTAFGPHGLTKDKFFKNKIEDGVTDVLKKASRPATARARTSRFSSWPGWPASTKTAVTSTTRLTARRASLLLLSRAVHRPPLVALPLRPLVALPLRMRMALPPHGDGPGPLPSALSRRSLRAPTVRPWWPLYGRSQYERCAFELNIEQPGAHCLSRRHRSPQGKHASFGLPDAGRRAQRARRARRTRHVRRGCPLLSTF
jgi:hypothetical protein